MSLIVRIMQEGSPRLMVTSPSLIEAEVQHGYELLTGFENIWAAQSGASNTVSGSFKNGVNTFTFQRSDSQETVDDSFIVDIPVANEKNNNSSARKLTKSQSVSVGARSGDHVAQNGFVVESSKRLSMPSGTLSAPAAPGQIWHPASYASRSEVPFRRQSSKRRPFVRQDAKEELIELDSNIRLIQGATFEESNFL